MVREVGNFILREGEIMRTKKEVIVLLMLFAVFCLSSIALALNI